MVKKLFYLFLILLMDTAIYANVIELSNDYIKIGVDNDTARFVLETVQGDINITGDDFQPLLYNKIPPTSMTTLNIDGEFVIYGSDSGYFKKRPYVDGKRIVTEWVYNDISIMQEVSFAKGPSTGLEDSMFINYRVQNQAKRKIKIGARILLDTLLGDKKPVSYGIPGKGNVDKETIFFRDNIPAYWYCFDNYENPVIRAQGTTIGYGTTKPDRLVFAAWDRFYDNPWELIIDSSKDFRRVGTSQFDSSAALFYDPVELDNDQQIYISTLYGIFGTSFFTDKDMLLSLTVPTDPKNPPIPVSADFINIAKVPLDKLTFEIFIPKGFSLSEGESNVVDFLKVDTNSTKRALWNLTSGSIGGNFNIKVRATGWVGKNTNIIEAEKSFNIDYLENMGAPVITNKEAPVAKVENQPKKEIKTVIEQTNGSTIYRTVTNTVQYTNGFVSEKERRLLQEISELDRLIDKVNMKYEVMMGIYKNMYLSNQVFIDDVEKDVGDFEDELDNQETILSNEQLNN